MRIASVERLNELKDALNGKKIAVIGDMMLDCYYWGKVKRISPEAPVPVVEVDDEFVRFGGAANVAYNIISLGGVPVPVGVIGKDNEADQFNKLMAEAGIGYEGLIVDETRPTTTKTRVMAGNQHLVRVDKESKEEINSDVEARIMKFLEAQITSLDAIILQDYNKGVLTESLIVKAIELANKHNKIVTVDPKFNNFFNYKNVTVFKPNRKETEDALGIKINDAEILENAGNELLGRLEADNVLLTLGEEGLSLFSKGHETKKIPTKARKVADVSGAGDTVISTLTIAIAAGAKIEEAAYLANYAGGLVCEEAGIVPINKDYLFSTVAKEIS